MSSRSSIPRQRAGFEIHGRGPVRICILRLFDKKLHRPAEHHISAVEEILVTHGDEILFRDETYTRPEAGGGKSQRGAPAG